MKKEKKGKERIQKRERMTEKRKKGERKTEKLKPWCFSTNSGSNHYFYNFGTKKHILVFVRRRLGGGNS